MALLFLKKYVVGGAAGNQQDASHSYSPVRSYTDAEYSAASDAESGLNEKFLGKNAVESSIRIDGRIVSDATIGLSDGLTVPFALTAGLSALGSSKVVIIGGLAELIAGSISMGLGGYLGAKSEAEGYRTTLAETQDLARRSPSEASAVIQESLSQWELPQELFDPLVSHLETSTERTTTFLMRFHHCMPEQAFEAKRAYLSALTIAAGYFFGGFMPLVPYFFVEKVSHALGISVLVMVFALFVFGFAKTRLVGQRSSLKCIVSGLQMVLLGGLAAAAAVACVRLASTLDGTEHGLI